MKRWLAQGSSGRRVTLLPRQRTFLHKNGTLHFEYPNSLNFFPDMNSMMKKVLPKLEKKKVLLQCQQHTHILKIPK